MRSPAVPADLLVVAGCTWLGVSLYAQLEIGFGTAAFYGGHAMELGGIAMIGIPTVLDLARGGASRPLVGDLTATELVATSEAFLGPRVRALLVRLIERDSSTAEHTRRVALLAARVGEELKLPAALRRDLAVGGLLHDIGKLSVPLEILQKPGPLDDEEFAEIRRHPDAGRRLLEELGGFPDTVRRLVSDHHERLDGTGYPRGLQGCDLSLETRILAACDVYDALVSDRVYRPAWPAERALALLREESGTGYDPKVVEALERIVTPTTGSPVVGGRPRGVGAARHPGPPQLPPRLNRVAGRGVQLPNRHTVQRRGGAYGHRSIRLIDGGGYCDCHDRTYHCTTRRHRGVAAHQRPARALREPSRHRPRPRRARIRRPLTAQRHRASGDEPVERDDLVDDLVRAPARRW